MPSTRIVVDGRTVVANVDGPQNGSAVVLLGTGAYDALCQRLYRAAIRTVVISVELGLTAKLVAAVLRSLGVSSALLVGDRRGGELAWQLAATPPHRFLGLVVIDCGHPAVADVAGVIGDEHCPPVEIATTVLVTTAATRAVARASQRYVYGDFRLIELRGTRGAAEWTAQLATEIVLRIVAR
jgi:pimeloyl-ACP methyl ester carboxylesterase